MSDVLYKRNESLIVATMNEETVMMDVLSGKYYSLGVTGGAIWNILEEPTSLEEIIEKLLQEFNVDKGVCSIQVQQFLEDAIAKEIIIIES